MANFIIVFCFFFVRKDYLWLPLLKLYNHNNNDIKIYHYCYYYHQKCKGCS